MAAGLVTRDRLRGPGFLRLFPDVYIPTPDEPPDLAMRSLAAYRYVEGRGVLSGYSAAELLGASCGSADAPAEVTVPGRGGMRTPTGLVIRRDRLAPDEITRVENPEQAGHPGHPARAGHPGSLGQLGDFSDVEVTTPLRTAYDLARRHLFTEAVVAIDALANTARFDPNLILHVAARYRGARGNDTIAPAVTHAHCYAGSPMESRLRMVIVRGGLPVPQVQWPVQDPQRRTAVWLDLAYPQHRIGIEYEGAEHTHPDQVLRDANRYTRLVATGWDIYRYTKYQIYCEPDVIVDDLTHALSGR